MDLYLKWIQFNQKKTLTLQNSTKEKYFIIRMKYAEHKIFCVCMKLYKVYEGKHYDKI